MLIETNGVTRTSLIKNPTKVYDIFTANDFLSKTGQTQVLAPDGVMRTPLLEDTKYVIHANFTWPKMLLPVTTNTVSALATEIVGMQARTKAFVADSDPDAIFWGREVNQFIITDMIFVDIGNSGAGHSSIFLNMVGGSRASRLTFTNTTFTKITYLGSATDFTLSFNPNVNFVNCIRGFAFDMSPYDLAPGANAFLGWRTINSTPVTMHSPYIAFTGTQVTNSITGGISAQDTADEFMRIDANATGNYDVVGNSFDGVGTLISTGKIASNSAYANLDLVVDSFSDSTVDAGVDTTVNVAVATLFHRGQTVRIGDEAAYNGEHIIVRVAADQMSFDINVVHSTSGPGTIKQTLVTAGSHNFVVKETIVISGTTNYDGTHIVSEIYTNNSYVIPHAYVADDATGTATSTSKIHSDTGITAEHNGPAESSTRVAHGMMNGNTGNTSFSTDEVYIGMNLGTVIDNQHVTERFTLTNSTIGMYTYTDPRPITVRVEMLAWIVKSVSTKNYRFALDKNGNTPIFTTSIDSVSDNGSGFARFNYTGDQYVVGQEVIIKDFAVNTDYNGHHIITAIGATYFEANTILFGSDEAVGFVENAYALAEVKTTSIGVSFIAFINLEQDDTLRVRIAPDGHTDACSITDFNISITEV